MDSTAPSGRLVSLDALRGFDMFWILGADALVIALSGFSASPVARFFAGQLKHKGWEGFGFYDLIFPLFVFIVGVTTVYSLGALIAKHGRAAAVKRVVRRAALLLLLGIFYNGGLTHAWPDVRLAGVLSRIALAYAATGLLFCYLKPRALAAVAAALLIGYWALLTFVPIRDLQLSNAALAARLGVEHPTMAQAHAAFDATTARVTGKFAPGLNLTNHLDFEYLPGRLYDHYYDPEGILSTLPAIATCLLGVFAGLLLRRTDFDERRKVRVLLLAGVAGIAAGWLWGLQFPVIKKIWTSSYVLVAGGWSFLLLAGFYYVVDVRQWRRWCQPFVWIGMNPITLYLISSIVWFPEVAQRLAGGSVSAWFDGRVGHGAGDIVVTIVGLGLMLALARFLYARKIFLRV
jgi:predicted acyltransferase